MLYCSARAIPLFNHPRARSRLEEDWEAVNGKRLRGKQGAAPVITDRISLDR